MVLPTEDSEITRAEAIVNVDSADILNDEEDVVELTFQAKIKQLSLIISQLENEKDTTKQNVSLQKFKQLEEECLAWLKDNHENGKIKDDAFNKYKEFIQEKRKEVDGILQKNNAALNASKPAASAKPATPLASAKPVPAASPTKPTASTVKPATPPVPTTEAQKAASIEAEKQRLAAEQARLKQVQPTSPTVSSSAAPSVSRIISKDTRLPASLLESLIKQSIDKYNSENSTDKINWNITYKNNDVNHLEIINNHTKQKVIDIQKANGTTVYNFDNGVDLKIAYVALSTANLPEIDSTNNDDIVSFIRAQAKLKEEGKAVKLTFSEETKQHIRQNMLNLPDFKTDPVLKTFADEFSKPDTPSSSLPKATK